ncbi:MAG TPA: ATP synthase subunit I [Acidimicrobiia bacterium]|nr:ATP synthase subunit I [Acidimicrobiia bacterium]
MIGDLLIGVGTGALAGVAFFGGLRWTVSHLIDNQRAAVWAAGSFVIRSAIVIALFLLMMDGSFTRAMAGLSGLILARTAIVAALRRGRGRSRESSWT